MSVRLGTRRGKERAGQSRSEGREPQSAPFWVSILAEFIGTFFLTFASTVPVVVSEATSSLGNADKVVPAGLVVAALIYTVGRVSGAHFNPAVTLAFAERRSFPWKCVPAYWGTQLLAALAAAGATVLIVGRGTGVGANEPHFGLWNSLLMEIICSFLLVLVILSTATQHKIVGVNAALAVGMTIALCGLVGGPVSGASMNPARSLGPAIAGGKLDVVWIYIVGPFAGATLAALVTTILHGAADGDERREATGAKSEVR